MNSPFPWLAEHEKGISLELTVVPRSSRSEIIGPHAERLKVALKAPPLDGKANRELLMLLSKFMGVPRRTLLILHGENTRRKTVLQSTLTLPESIETIQQALKA